jgi:hypothetical protein
VRDVAEAGPPPRPPRRASAARPAADRLAAGRLALAGLLTGLGPLAGDTGREAAAGERALRAQVEQVTAVETALYAAPAAAVPGLLAARDVLVAALTAGVETYERLVVAAADCVAAAAGGVDSLAARRLTEAGDALAGLARGLDETRAINRAAGL